MSDSRKRKIYTAPLFNELQQGSIINGCLAERYIGKEVYGLVITPRCDIENYKVATVHYLPVVKEEDWLMVGFWDLFSQILIKDLRTRLEGILKRNGLSEKVATHLNKDFIQKLPNEIKKEKDKDQFILFANDLLTLSKNTEIDLLEKKACFLRHEKLFKSLLREVKENKRKEFYLLESWRNQNEYYIILLREIRKLGFNLSKKIGEGIYAYQLPKNELESSDLTTLEGEESYFCCETVVLPPFIEHVIQCFFVNFGRVGVDNFISPFESDMLAIIKNN